MNIKSFLLGFLFLFGISCSPGTDITGRPDMAVSKQQIKVGESVTIVMTKFGGEFQGDPNYTFVTKAFIYSPVAGSEPAPYAPLSEGGFVPSTLPELFPIQNSLKVTAPISQNTQVPILQATTVENGSVKAQFTVEGVSIGTIKLRGGFLVNSTQYPNNYVRIPMFPTYDGEVTIQVVP